MPELPEVETVKRILEKEIVGLTFKEPVIKYPRLIQTPIEEFNSVIPQAKIISLARKGKFLIINLDKSYSLLVHFRMEGKLFHFPHEDENINKYTSMYFKMSDGSVLVFNDTRKFGVMYLYKTEDLETLSPLNKLGKEPWDITSSDYLLRSYKNKTYCLKEAMLDQSVISGLGNIYADEVLFASHLNPFRKANTLTSKEAERIIISGREILDKAIQNHGSTIRSYHPSSTTSGAMQFSLKVYDSKGKLCPICDTKIEKRYVGGRGTCYCPMCQKVYPSFAITGKIACGKSKVLEMFKERGFFVESADDIVHRLYKDKAFLSKLQTKFPSVFDEGNLDKKKVMENMMNDKKFRRSYQMFIWSNVKDKINEFLITHSSYYQVVEVPLLFEAKMEKDFTYLIGVETNRQKEYLAQRHDENPSRRLEMNSINSYDHKRDLLNYIISNNNDVVDLEKQVDQIIDNVSNKWFGTCK